MKTLKRTHIVLIVFSVLILLGSIGMTGYLLFSNYQNVKLLKQARTNFLQGDDFSLNLAETQLLQLVRSDGDNEAAFIMLGEIARRKKVYPEQVYYCFMAYRLNPLSKENKEKYIDSLCFVRYFDRLETLLAQESSLSNKQMQLLLYAAGHNGNINKYKQQSSRQGGDNRIGELALLLFKHDHLKNDAKLAKLKQLLPDADAFLKQEILAAQTELFLSSQDIDQAEKSLFQAYELNQYAFAPVLGRFYANHRNLKKALKVLEKHLEVYHDQSVAIQTAEIYCLLNKADKIAKLRTDYQSDSGNRAMLSSYYFDALIALAKKDITGLKELTPPLRKNINTPLSAFMFFCADLQGYDLSAILTSYTTLLAHRNYLNLKEQADNMLSEYLKFSFLPKKNGPQTTFEKELSVHLKKAFAEINTNQDKLPLLASILYNRKPEAFTAKVLLLAQKKINSLNVVLLKDALKRFGNDHGILKIAIEYYLKHELPEAERLIADYKQKFPQRSNDMLNYEIAVNWQKKDYEKISELYRKNYSPSILPKYWTFASSTARESDLLFLSRDKFYEPFCKALLFIKQGKMKEACDLLEKAEANKNQALLFFAAKTLAENGRNQAALKIYAEFPKDSPYRILVLLNMSELYAEAGDLKQAVILANRAYQTAPRMQETQLCYADKLYRTGNIGLIPDIIKINSSNTYRRRMEPLWIAGMQQRIKECSIQTQREKIRELCRQLLVISPDNNIAHEYLKKIRLMPQ